MLATRTSWATWSLTAATQPYPRVSVGVLHRDKVAVIQLTHGHPLLAGRDYLTPEETKTGGHQER